MKKLLALSLSVMMALSFAGCQNSSNPAASEMQEKSLSSVAETSAVKDIYDFYAYENDDVFYIDKVDVKSSELEAECVTYEFSFMSDGYPIKGYISIPVESIQTRKPCKCILYNRGGHAGSGNLKGSEIAWVCAESKRIVIGCELRGNDGSGGYEQYGGDEVHDVIRLIDFCENEFPFVDMDDFCSMGGSRGGMTTYMAARQDKRIKKIISFSAISDMFMMYEAREDMRKYLPMFIGGTPEEKPEEYEKRSAVCWADELKIPVLLIHSRGDKVVPFAQAEKLYEKLKDITECTFIIQDDDYHGLHEEDFPKVLEWLENT